MVINETPIGENEINKLPDLDRQLKAGTIRKETHNGKDIYIKVGKEFMSDWQNLALWGLMTAATVKGARLYGKTYPAIKDISANDPKTFLVGGW